MFCFYDIHVKFARIINILLSTCHYPSLLKAEGHRNKSKATITQTSIEDKYEDTEVSGDNIEDIHKDKHKGKIGINTRDKYMDKIETRDNIEVDKKRDKIIDKDKEKDKDKVKDKDKNGNEVEV